MTEARACLSKAKLHLANSKNLKTDIKIGVTEAINRLFQLVKEADSTKGQTKPPKKQDSEKEAKETGKREEKDLERILERHMEMLHETNEQMRALKATLEKETCVSGHTEAQNDDMDRLLGEMRELRRTTEETGRKVSCIQETAPSYAEVLARPNSTTTPSKLRPKHSIIVSSEIEKDTSDEVLGKVREALEAKTSGLQITRVQKIKNQKIVLSCSSKEEIKKMTEKINSRNINLKVEEARNKDPLIMIKNLLSFNKDEEIVASLRSQNKNILGDLTAEEFRAIVRYRRRARNPHENHVVLQVSPKVWQKLTVAKRVHIDLQYAAVQDQSPLIQCTRCLGYGHGRRLCTETTDLCSYCAGPHLRADCPAQVMGETPVCRNCRSAKYHEFGHNAFDVECPVRKRWDAIARSSVSYC